MSDYFLSVSTETDFIERHVDLSSGPAERLERKLGELKAAGKIVDFTLDGSEPEYWTSGYADTLAAVMEIIPEEGS